MGSSRLKRGVIPIVQSWRLRRRYLGLHPLDEALSFEAERVTIGDFALGPVPLWGVFGLLGVLVLC